VEIAEKRGVNEKTNTLRAFRRSMNSLDDVYEEYGIEVEEEWGRG